MGWWLSLVRAIRGQRDDMPEGYVPDPHQYVDMHCQILAGTEYPCGNTSAFLAGTQQPGGRYKKIYLCQDHNPQTDNWTRRFFEIRDIKILDVRPIWR